VEPPVTGSEAARGLSAYAPIQKKKQKNPGGDEHVWPHLPPTPHRNCHEMGLELVSGDDFWCKLMSGGRPVDLRGSRGRFPG